MDCIEEYNGMLWYLVRKFTAKDKTINEQDLMQEARIAAMVAISKYDSKKSASLKTFISRCVQNRLMDVCNRKVLQASKEPLPFEILEENGGEYTLEDVEFDLTMRALLSSLEYKVYYKSFVEDKSERDIMREMSLTRHGVRRCLHHILRSYQSIVESRNKVSTQLRLQENWLVSSPI